jgi:hypothetical protein
VPLVYETVPEPVGQVVNLVRWCKPAMSSE